MGQGKQGNLVKVQITCHKESDHGQRPTTEKTPGQGHGQFDLAEAQNSETVWCWQSLVNLYRMDAQTASSATWLAWSLSGDDRSPDS